MEQNRQLAANLDNSQEAVVALAAEVEKLTKRLAHVEDPTGARAAARALESPSGGERRKSSKKHRTRDPADPAASSRRKSGKKSSSSHSAAATPESAKASPAPPPPAAPSPVPVVERGRSGSPLLPRSPGARKEESTVTTVTRKDTPPKRLSNGDDGGGSGTTITTITTTTIITKQQTTSPGPPSPRVAGKRPARRSVPGLNLQQNLKPSGMMQRTSGGGSGLGASQASPTVKGTPTKSPPSTAHAPEREKLVPAAAMLSDRSGGAHHCLDVEGKLGACRQCPVRCAAFRPHASGPSWMCAECGHLNIKHLGSPRGSSL